LPREVVKLAGDEVVPIALKSEGKPRIPHAEEHETVRYSESAGILIENECNLSEGGMLYNEPR